MIQLTRTIRFCLSADGTLACDGAKSNTFAAWPAMRGLGAYYELLVTCEGEVDEVTGYFVNIKEIDEVVREHGLPVIEAHAKQRDNGLGLGGLMVGIVEGIVESLNNSLREVVLKLSPTYSLGIEDDDMSHVLMSQQYEFSAAHRLHSDLLSDEANLATYGKCNNPAGHGHNYKVEVTVRCPIGEDGSVVDVASLDQLVDDVVIERFDHKHLNLDTAEFASVNSSVENISKVVYELLVGEVGGLGDGVKLEEIKVWETGKTVCSYRG